jgi:PAS domain S-box-containing protein
MSKKNPRILIVEDEAILAAHLGQILGQMGYRVAGPVSSGQAAIDLASKEKPDAVLMDIRLSGEMTGIEAAEKIGLLADVPIIYLTAYSEDVLVQQAKFTEAYAFLIKPIRERDLRISLEMAIYKHAAEAELKHLNQVLRAVRDINHLITQERDSRLLMEEACRILLRTRDYTLVWIGRPDSENGPIVPIVRAGQHVDYLDVALEIRGRVGAENWPADRAYRSREPVIIRDTADDDSVGAWRDAAGRHGLVSLASIPIRHGHRRHGVLTVYADTVDIFGEEEVGLLTELAADLAYAIETLDEEAARRRAEGDLKQAKEYAEQLLALIPSGLYSVDSKKRITTWNRKAEEIIGYSADEVIGRDCGFFALSPCADLCGLFAEDVPKPITGGEFTIKRKDGRIRFLLKNADLLRDAAGGIIGGIESFEDITERREAEERLRQSYQDLRETFREVIKALSAAIEMRDPYTAGHQERVTRLAVAIAREMELAGETIAGIQIAGAVHDIGKLAIPAEILSKPTKLSTVEYSLIQSHPQIGFTILENIRFPWPIARIVLQHHERMDGSGYPNKVKGPDILIEARIIAVADVVEAMSSHRPYRAALGLEPALDEIAKGRSIWYDPSVVDACLKIVREARFTFDATRRP